MKPRRTRSSSSFILHPSSFLSASLASVLLRWHEVAVVAPRGTDVVPDDAVAVRRRSLHFRRGAPEQRARGERGVDVVAERRVVAGASVHAPPRTTVRRRHPF